MDKELKRAYKFVYVCSKCKREFGADKEEKGTHLCPLHDPNFKERKVVDFFRR